MKGRWIASHPSANCAKGWGTLFVLLGVKAGLACARQKAHPAVRVLRLCAYGASLRMTAFEGMGYCFPHPFSRLICEDLAAQFASDGFDGGDDALREALQLFVLERVVLRLEDGSQQQ
jgi:hypothetical protein